MAWFKRLARQRRDTPDTVLAALLSAHRIEDRQRLVSLCADHEGIIVSSFAAWRKVAGIDRPELDHYVDTLVTVAEVFAGNGQPQLKALLVGGETPNPLDRWSQVFTESQILVSEGRCSEVIAPLKEWLGIMQEASGSGVDDLLPKTHGLLGIAYYEMGLLENAVDHTKTALSMCELIGDTDGVAIYAANLQQMVAEDRSTS